METMSTYNKYHKAYYERNKDKIRDKYLIKRRDYARKAYWAQKAAKRAYHEEMLKPEHNQ